MFKELVFYLEACESGSMFPNLASDTGIYAMTASNASQSSWGTYCGSDAYVDGHNIGSCLGDLFSVNWMEDTEANDVSVETIQVQHDTVKTLTNMSPVCEFGDMSFKSEVIGDFEGTLSPTDSLDIQTMAEQLIGKAGAFYNHTMHPAAPKTNNVNSRDHDLYVLYERVMMTGSTEDMQALEAELASRQFADDLFDTHFPDLGEDAPAQV